MPSSSVALVILNYNTRALLAACLQSAQKFAADAHVVVVDNASTDDSAAMVRAQFPAVSLIANTQNRGFARGMNQGLHQTSAPFVFALNADIELTAMTLPHLLDTAAQLPRAGILGPAQFAPDGAWRAATFPDPTLLSEAARLVFFTDVFAARLRRGPWREIAGTPRRVDWLMGAALLLRRECFAAIRGFDETQFMYGEDWDLCYRARGVGWQVWFVPAAKIIHHENAAGKFFFGVHRQAQVLQANLYFHEKHFGQTSRRALAWFYLLGAAMRLPLWAFRSDAKSNARRRAQIGQARVAWRALGARSCRT